MYLLLFQDLSCIKDMISLYEAATVEDVYVAYEQLKIDENCLFSCIGIAGSQAGENVIGEQLLGMMRRISYL